MTRRLDGLFAPRGIAVIGASTDPTKMGSVMAHSLSAFPGPVVPVNERAPDPRAGLYSSVAEGASAVGAPIDLAVLCVPAAVCADALDRAAAAGVRAALVCAGGFAEAGVAGEQAQSDLLDVARRHGVRVLGPNTSGFISPRRGLYATFVPGARDLKPGSVGVVAASGGMNHAVAFLLDAAGHGVSLAVGLGNAIDVATAQVVDHLAEDPDTRAIALHIESVQDGRRLLEAVRRASTAKPVVALVVGRADVADFARSHTGALATAWRTTRDLLAQAGAVVVDDEQHLVDAIGALSLARLPAVVDPGVAVVTAQAGPGLLLLDQLRQHGVRLPELASSTREALGRLLPPITYQSNPVDTGRPAQSFGEVISVVANDPSVDLVAVYALAEPGAVDLVEAMRIGSTHGAVLAAAIGGMQHEGTPLRNALIANGIPAAGSPTALADRVRSLVADARQRGRRSEAPLSESLPDNATRLIRGARAWTEHDAKTVLDALGIATPRRRVYEDAESAGHALDHLRPPLAVKLLDARVVHKTDIGGVHLGVRTVDELKEALQKLSEIGAETFLVEEMACAGVDLLVGARRDPVFGPVVLVGLGGTMAEALADATLRAAPLTLAEACEMPDDLEGAALLRGWRGGPAVAGEELGRVVCLLGQLIADYDELDDIEINPLRLTSAGLIALDAVITTRRSDESTHQ